MISPTNSNEQFTHRMFASEFGLRFSWQQLVKRARADRPFSEPLIESDAAVDLIATAIASM